MAARGVIFGADAWNGRVPDNADPLSFPPAAFAGRTFLLYASKEDNVIPAGATTADFAARFGYETTIEMRDCDGGHVASACFDGDRVKDLITTLA
jgi:hypothetical protein